MTYPLDTWLPLRSSVRTSAKPYEHIDTTIYSLHGTVAMTRCILRVFLTSPLVNETGYTVLQSMFVIDIAMY